MTAIEMGWAIGELMFTGRSGYQVAAYLFGQEAADELYEGLDRDG